MITLTFHDFYSGGYTDQGYDLYAIINEHKAVLYVGISRISIWDRWFGSLFGHMRPIPGGSLRGISPIGEEIERCLPDSWNWSIELWTKNDCVTELLDQGVMQIGGRDVRNLGIQEIEAFLISKLSPPYNTLHAGGATFRAPEGIQQLRGTVEVMTIEACLDQYIGSIASTNSASTVRAYSNALHVFRDVLSSHGIETALVPVNRLDEDAILWLADRLRDYSRASQKLYVHVVASFCKYLAAEGLANIKMPRLSVLPSARTRLSGSHVPASLVADVNGLLGFVSGPEFANAADEQERLRALRDKAFLLTLADTGLRVHEACKLRRGDVDRNEGQAVIIGKGDQQAIVRFSTRALAALKGYLDARGELDGASGKPLAALPLFARHDKGAGKKVKPITTATGRNIVHERVEQALGKEVSGRITPHSLRHYFVTAVLRGSGNLKMAQELARHKSIAVTQRYAHLSNDELDRGYDDIFNRSGTKK